LLKVSQVESSAQLLPEKLKFPFQFTSDMILTVKLACLVSAIPEEAERELSQLKYSRNDLRNIITLLKTFSQLKDCYLDQSLRNQYFLFLSAGNTLPFLALFAMVHQFDLDWIIFLMDRYLNSSDPVAHPQPLVKGNDLMQSLSIPPSPRVGQLLTELQIAQIEGKISTAESAINLAKAWLDMEELLP
jgi:tRNA nucleotidyltransferase (CCA-adding enzyme)